MLARDTFWLFGAGSGDMERRFRLAFSARVGQSAGGIFGFDNIIGILVTVTSRYPEPMVSTSVFSAWGRETIELCGGGSATAQEGSSPGCSVDEMSASVSEEILSSASCEVGKSGSMDGLNEGSTHSAYRHPIAEIVPAQLCTGEIDRTTCAVVLRKFHELVF